MVGDAGSAVPALAGVSREQWAGLARQRIFFGHQSVGRNIMDGVGDVLAAAPQIRLSVIESKNLDSGALPGFYHAKVGRNRYPIEKVDEFVRVAERAFPRGGIAMVKLCYVDVQPDTDPRALFEAYRQRVETLHSARPGLTILHFTMPVTRPEGHLSYWKKKLRGEGTERDLNIVRNRYNALLRQAYDGREPVFDIARIESTAPNGSRAFFSRGADTVYVMAPDYSDDGGHLNPAGRRLVAEQLLILLARTASEDSQAFGSS